MFHNAKSARLPTVSVFTGVGYTDYYNTLGGGSPACGCALGSLAGDCRHQPEQGHGDRDHVQSEEPVQGRVGDVVVAPDPHREVLADDRDRRECRR